MSDFREFVIVCSVSFILGVSFLWLASWSLHQRDMRVCLSDSEQTEASCSEKLK